MSLWIYDFCNLTVKFLQSEVELISTSHEIEPALWLGLPIESSEIDGAVALNLNLIRPKYFYLLSLPLEDYVNKAGQVVVKTKDNMEESHLKQGHQISQWLANHLFNY